MPFDRSSGRLALVGSAAQSLVDYVRLAALCGLERCKTAEDPMREPAPALDVAAPAAGARVGKLRESGGDRLYRGRIQAFEPIAISDSRRTTYRKTYPRCT